MKAVWNDLILLFVGFSLFACSKKQSTMEQQTISAKETATPSLPTLVDSLITNECYYEDLSPQHNYILRYTRPIDSTRPQKDYWTIIVLDKKSNRRQDSLQQAMISYGSKFQDFKNVRSHITGKNSKDGIVDNNYGDMIIADLNFDSLEDIALVNDLGGNGGRFYSYYIQNKDRKFVMDKFLTDSMVYFPAEFHIKRKQLITYVHAGVCGLGAHVYSYNSKSNTWKETRHRLINVCKE